MIPTTSRITPTLCNTDALQAEIIAQYQFWNSVPQSEFKSCKSNAKASALRDSGNQRYKGRKFRDALDLYTQSVAMAVDDTEELALAFANRSAVLFELNKYLPCLLDINRALNSKYPDRLNEKLHDRKRRCLTQLKKDGIAVKGDETNPPKANFENDSQWRDICNFGNPLLPDASRKITLKSNEKYGRHIVATENIEAGEILSVEEYFLLIVMPEKKYNNCSYCLSKCDALIPCPSCTQMMYCSKDCLVQAYNSYHRTECKLSLNERETLNDWLKKLDCNQSYVDFQEYSRKNVIRMAVRALLLGTQQGTQLENLMKKLTIKEIFQEKVNPTNKPYAIEYLNALRILRTFDTLSLSQLSPDPISFAVKLIIELRHLSFFGNQSNSMNDASTKVNQINEVECFATMLLINHAVSIKINTMGIDQMRNSDVLGECSETAGAGVCVLNNFYNHSCNPNSRFFTRGRKHVACAVRPIKRGEQIFTSYYDTFIVRSKEDRMVRNLQYGFMCECEACSNNWPLLEHLFEREIEFLNKNKNREEFLHDLKEIMIPVLRDSCERSNSEIFQVLAKCVTWLNVNIKSPAWITCINEEIFAKFMMLSFSNLYDEYMAEIRNDKVIEKLMDSTLSKLFEDASPESTPEKV